MAICSFAQNHTDIPNVGGPMQSYRLGVVHIMAGTLAGTDGWFHNPQAQVSAHFGIGKDGTIIQWVDTSRMAWAEMDYNGEAISVEHEGQSGDTLTFAQAVSLAKLMDWCAFVHGIPIQRQTNPDAMGWIGHGELGVSGGNHPDCPGQPILDQLPTIIHTAATPPPAPAPPAPNPFPTLQPGDTNPAVQTLRNLIIKKGYKVPAVGTNYGSLLVAAVVDLKTKHGLPSNGIVGGRVWNLLNS